MILANSLAFFGFVQLLAVMSQCPLVWRHFLQLFIPRFVNTIQKPQHLHTTSCFNNKTSHFNGYDRSSSERRKSCSPYPFFCSFLFFLQPATRKRVRKVMEEYESQVRSESRTFAAIVDLAKHKAKKPCRRSFSDVSSLKKTRKR